MMGPPRREGPPDRFDVVAVGVVDPAAVAVAVAVGVVGVVVAAAVVAAVAAAADFVELYQHPVVCERAAAVEAEILGGAHVDEARRALPYDCLPKQSRSSKESLRTLRRTQNCCCFCYWINRSHARVLMD
jgi:hypothetical protein